MEREVWEQADLEQRRRIVKLMVERIDIMPTDRSQLQKQTFFRYKFRPEDVVITWKL